MNNNLNRNGPKAPLPVHRTPLVAIQRRAKFSTVDLDTWRDGDYSISAEDQERIVSFLCSKGVRRFDFNHKGFTAHRVPNEIALEVAEVIGQIAARHRCQCAKSECTQ